MLLILVCLLIFAVTGGSHAFLLLTHDDKMQVGFVKAGIYIGQLAVSVQVIVVMRRMDIHWQEPFLTFLSAFDFISLEELVHSLNVVSCVTRFSPTMQFLFQTVAVPFAFMTGPTIVHLMQCCSARRTNRAKKQGTQIYVLGETFGMLCMLFFIVLCTAVLEPFDCVSHPKLALTMRTATEVHCNFRTDSRDIMLAACWLLVLHSCVPYSTVSKLK